MEIKLVDLKEGVKAEVVRFECGFGMQQHLSSLDLKLESVVRKIPLKASHGPVMIEVNGNKITIGRGMAKKIFVKEIEEK